LAEAESGSKQTDSAAAKSGLVVVVLSLLPEKKRVSWKNRVTEGSIGGGCENMDDRFLLTYNGERLDEKWWCFLFVLR